MGVSLPFALGAFLSLGPAVALLGCGDPPEAPTPVPSPAPLPVEVLAPRPVASSSSFDLVPFDDGAVLIWGGPNEPAPAIFAIAAGPLGEARGSEHLIAPRLALELAAIADGTRIAVAWVAQQSGRAVVLETETAFAPGGVESFGPPSALGQTDPGLRTGRGRLAMSGTDDGAMLLSHRIEAAPCTSHAAASSGSACARLSRSRVDIPGPGRGDDPLEVPEACEPFVTGSVLSHGTVYQALCHAEAGVSITTVYAIRSSISLAAASDVLAGCTPRALVPTEMGAALVASCPEGLGVSWQDDVGQPGGEIRDGTLSAGCEAGRPVLSASGAGRTLRVPLTAPQARIEGLLPSGMAGGFDRAVWTGHAILVARYRLDGGRAEVALARWQCEGDLLRRTDL